MIGKKDQAKIGLDVDQKSPCPSDSIVPPGFDIARRAIVMHQRAMGKADRTAQHGSSSPRVSFNVHATCPMKDEYWHPKGGSIAASSLFTA
jgi:hypothetical protein